MAVASHSSVRAFCVGQAKSGTASLVGLLGTHYSAAHEPERAETLDLVLRESRGEVSEDDVRSALRSRDERLHLEYDIAWANQFLIGQLLTVFPEAKFIVLVRDPYTWLQSVAGHFDSRQIPPDVRLFLDWWFRPDLYPHSAHDKALAGRGLYSIAACLHAWVWHVTTCERLIARDRRLTLRTHELHRSYAQIAEFLEVPLAHLDARQGHLNRSTSSFRLESAVARDYVEEMVRAIGGDVMARYFPEVNTADDARKLWTETAA